MGNLILICGLTKIRYDGVTGYNTEIQKSNVSNVILFKLNELGSVHKKFNIELGLSLQGQAKWGP